MRGQRGTQPGIQGILLWGRLDFWMSNLKRSVHPEKRIKQARWRGVQDGKSVCRAVHLKMFTDILMPEPLLPVSDTTVKRRNISTFIKLLSRDADAFVSPTQEHPSWHCSLVKYWLCSKMSNHEGKKIKMNPMHEKWIKRKQERILSNRDYHSECGIKTKARENRKMC